MLHAPSNVHDSEGARRCRLHGDTESRNDGYYLDGSLATNSVGERPSHESAEESTTLQCGNNVGRQVGCSDFAQAFDSELPVGNGQQGT